MSPFHDLNEMFIGLQSFSADLHGGLRQSLKVPLIGLSFRGRERENSISHYITSRENCHV